MPKMLYEVKTRSQRAKKGRSGFSGPDTYVALVSWPESVWENGAPKGDCQ